MTSLRTSLPPSENECDEKLALRAAWTCMLRDVERARRSPAAPCSDRRTALSPTNTSVTALVKYGRRRERRRRSRRCAPGCARRRRSACAVRHHRPASAAGRRRTGSASGCSRTTPSGMWTYAPSLDERGVQRGEARRAEVGELPEIALDDVGLRRSTAAASDPARTPARQAVQPRQLGGEPAVDDDQPQRSGARVGQAVERPPRRPSRPAPDGTRRRRSARRS